MGVVIMLFFLKTSIKQQYYSSKVLLLSIFFIPLQRPMLVVLFARTLKQLIYKGRPACESKATLPF